MMKLRVQHVMDATICLTSIINRAPVMPQKGKYRIARMHSKLLPEWKLLDARRDEMIKAYNTPQLKTENLANGEVLITPVPDQWMVPPEKMAEYTEAWKAVGDEEIEVDVQPIPLSHLCLDTATDGAIEASELIILGNLISED